MSYIIRFGLLLLCVLWFKVRYRSVTRQCHAELCVDHKIVPAWSQFCRKAIFFFIWVFRTAFFFVLWGGKLGKVVEIYEGCFSRCKCSCSMQRVTACVFVGAEQESRTIVPVTDRSNNILLDIIKVCIFPGTTIISD